MSGQPVIEPGKFARVGGVLRGSIVLSEMARLREALPKDAGTASYHIRGFLDARERPAIELDVGAEVTVACQRCLGPMAVRVASQRTVVFQSGADEFAPMDDEDESEDIVPEVQQLDVRQLVEEELLLSLPISPRHEEGNCEGDAAMKQDDSPAESASPFAILGSLRR